MTTEASAIQGMSLDARYMSHRSRSLLGTPAESSNALVGAMIESLYGCFYKLRSFLWAHNKIPAFFSRLPDFGNSHRQPRALRQGSPITSIPFDRVLTIHGSYAPEATFQLTQLPVLGGPGSYNQAITVLATQTKAGQIYYKWLIATVIMDGYNYPGPPRVYAIYHILYTEYHILYAIFYTIY